MAAQRKPLPGILPAHADLVLLPDEPFNENFVDWSPDNPEYLARGYDINALDAVLAELFGLYDGITVLSYQLDQEQLRHLVLRPDIRVISISRRNLLHTAVSDRVAKQTKLWNRWDADPAQPLERYYGSLDPLDLDDLRCYVSELTTHLHWMDSVLKLRKDRHVFQQTAKTSTSRAGKRSMPTSRASGRSSEWAPSAAQR